MLNLLTQDLKDKLKKDIEEEMEDRNLTSSSIRVPKAQHGFPVSWRTLNDICKKPKASDVVAKQFAIIRLLNHFGYNYIITGIHIIGKSNEQ